MPSPIILNFAAGQSLASINSLTVEVGVSWGTITLPLAPLDFSPENVNKIFQMPVIPCNEDFYEDYYSNLPLIYRNYFLDPSLSITKGPISVAGINIGISASGVINEAAQAVDQLLTSAIRNIYAKALSKVGLGSSFDALQVSQSGSVLLHGLNHRDTYNMDIHDFAGALNVCLIQASAGCVTSVAVNLLFVGKFRSFRNTALALLNSDDSFSILPVPGIGLSYSTIHAVYNYLQDVFNNSVAFAVIPDAAIGVILPGAQASVIFS